MFVKMHVFITSKYFIWIFPDIYIDFYKTNCKSLETFSAIQKPY